MIQCAEIMSADRRNIKNVTEIEILRRRLNKRVAIIGVTLRLEKWRTLGAARGLPPTGLFPLH